MTKKHRLKFFPSVMGSVASFSFYSHIYHQKIWATLRYLSLYVLLYVVVVVAVFGYGIYRAYTPVAPEIKIFLQEIPEIKIQNGSASVTPDIPYVREFGVPGGDAMTLIIDAHISTTELDAAYPLFQQGIVIGKDGVVVQRRQNDRLSVDVIGYRSFGSMVVNAELLKRWMKWLVILGVTIAPLIIWVVQMVSKLVFAMIAVLTVWAIFAIMHRRYAFASLFNVVIYALTGPTLLTLILMVFGVHMASYLPILVFVIYCIGAIRFLPLQGKEAEG